MTFITRSWTLSSSLSCLKWQFSFTSMKWQCSLLENTTNFEKHARHTGVWMYTNECCMYDNCFDFILQIYNETARDLLQPSSKTLAVREDPKQGVCVTGLSLHKVSSKFIWPLKTRCLNTFKNFNLFFFCYLVISHILACHPKIEFITGKKHGKVIYLIENWYTEKYLSTFPLDMSQIIAPFWILILKKRPQNTPSHMRGIFGWFSVGFFQVLEEQFLEKFLILKWQISHKKLS